MRKIPAKDETILSPFDYPISFFPYDPESGSINDIERCSESVILHFLRLTSGDHFSEKYPFLKEDPTKTSAQIEFLKYMKEIPIPDTFFTPRNCDELSSGFMKTFYILGKMLDLETDVKDVLGGKKWLENLCSSLGEKTGKTITVSHITLRNGVDRRESQDIYGDFKITVNNNYSFNVSMEPFHGQIFKLSAEGKLKEMIQERTTKFTKALETPYIDRNLKIYLRAIFTGPHPDSPSIFKLMKDPLLMDYKEHNNIAPWGAFDIPFLFSSIQYHAIYSIMIDNEINRHVEEYLSKIRKIIDTHPEVKTNLKDHFEKSQIDPNIYYSPLFFDFIKNSGLENIRISTINSSMGLEFANKLNSNKDLLIERVCVDYSNQSDQSQDFQYFLRNAKIPEISLYNQNKDYLFASLGNENNKYLYLYGDWGTQWSYLDKFSIEKEPDRIILFQNQQSLDSFRSSFDRKFGWIAQNVF